jgi:hypothetical protein
MLNLCGIVVGSLKMMTARNFSLSGINSGHHNLPTYEMSLKSDNVEFVRHCTTFHMWVILWCPKFIPDIEKFLAVVIFKMATTIPHKFNIVRFQRISNFDDIGKCWICAVLWWPFWKWRPLEIFHCRESIRDFIIYPHMKCRTISTTFHMWVDYEVPNWFPTMKNF